MPVPRAVRALSCGCGLAMYSVKRQQYLRVSSIASKYRATDLKLGPQTSSPCGNRHKVQGLPLGIAAPHGQAGDDEALGSVRLSLCKGVSRTGAATASDGTA